MTSPADGAAVVDYVEDELLDALVPPVAATEVIQESDDVSADPPPDHVTAAAQGDDAYDHLLTLLKDETNNGADLEFYYNERDKEEGFACKLCLLYFVDHEGLTKHVYAEHAQSVQRVKGVRVKVPEKRKATLPAGQR